MSQQVQELIDKIKTEGVQSARQEAQEITSQAQGQASKINEEAKAASDQLLIGAKEEIKKMQESTNMALAQSSRDMLLALKGKIKDTLKDLISTQIKDALTSEKLADIIAEVIKSSSEADQSSSDIRVALNASDLKALKDGFIGKLQKSVKGKLAFESSDDIDKGFTISYDAGKSSFDFTDESLAQYLSQYLNAEVSDILNKSV